MEIIPQFQHSRIKSNIEATDVHISANAIYLLIFHLPRSMNSASVLYGDITIIFIREQLYSYISHSIIHSLSLKGFQIVDTYMQKLSPYLLDDFLFISMEMWEARKAAFLQRIN